MRPSTRIQPIALLALCLALSLPTTIALAETIEAGYRGCEFHDAVRAANTNQPVGNCRAGDPGHDHIFVDGVIALTEPPIPITEDLAIVGDRETSTLDGRGRHSFLHIGAGVTVNLQDYFMTNGYGTRQSGQIRVDSGARLHLNTVEITNCKGVKEIVAPADALVVIGYAASVCGKREPFNPHPPILPPPRSGDPRPDDGRDSRANAPVAAQPTPSAQRQAYTCETLPAHIVVRPVAGTRSGIQCQELNDAGVGKQAIINAGIQAAVDIWSYVAPGFEVCLRGRGSLLFLDAATAPRAVSRIGSYPQGDMTCAFSHHAGSFVLVQPDATQPGADESPHTLRNCQIRTLDSVFFRNAPNGEQIYSLLPPDTVSNADARTLNWFRIWLDGVAGWVSASYVQTSGACG